MRRDHLSEQTISRLVDRFQKQFPDNSIQVRGRIMLSQSAFSVVPTRVSAYIAFENFRISEQTRLQQARRFGEPLEAHELLMPILGALDGVVESCIISFVKPFTTGKKGKDSNNIGANKQLGTFLRTDVISILTQQFGMPLEEIVDEAIDQRHQMIAHADGSFYKYGEREGARILEKPVSGATNKSLRTGETPPQHRREPDDSRRTFMKELGRTAELFKAALDIVQRV